MSWLKACTEGLDALIRVPKLCLGKLRKGRVGNTDAKHFDLMFIVDLAIYGETNIRLIEYSIKRI